METIAPEILEDQVCKFVQANSGNHDVQSIAKILTGQMKGPMSGSLRLYTEHEIITVLKNLIADNRCYCEQNSNIVFDQRSLAKPPKPAHICLRTLEHLKEWRRDVCKNENTQAYYVANNEGLEYLASTKVSTVKELLRVPGLPARTIRKHARQLLQINATMLLEPQANNDKSSTNVEEKPDNFSHLNDEQWAVVCAPHNRVACVAGAGSGKTTVLVHKIMHDLQNTAAKNMLAISFTRKAAQELKARIMVVAQDKSAQITSGTFNSFCDRMLRQLSNNDYSVADDKEMLYMLTQVMEHESVDNEEIFNLYLQLQKEDDPNEKNWLACLQYIIKIIDYRRNAATTFEHMNKNCANAYEHQFLKFAQQIEPLLQQEKEKLNIKDYTDQLVEFVQIIKENQNLRETLQNRFTHIYIDEYQDTNPIQQELLELLLTEQTKLFIVGDNRQSIYSFRGAKPEYFEHIQDNIKDAHIMHLRSNYRCASQIVSFANDVAKSMPNVVDQLAMKDNKGTIKYITTKKPEEEAMYVSQHIKLLHVRNRIAYNDMFIIARTHQQLKIFERVLNQHDIDTVTRTDKHFERPLPHQVVLTTVHAAKGLEATAVFIVGLVQGTFPIKGAKEPFMERIKNRSQAMRDAEELRLFYVAATRAQEHLYLSWYMHDGKRARSKSTFLSEKLMSKYYSS